ncbi:MAG: hypothetical protein ABR575_05110 [Actinomycetota bacterium]
MAEENDSGEDAKVDAVACSDVTDLDCDYIAERDPSADWADRGQVSDQLLAQLTTHVAKKHPDHALSPKRIDEIRSRITR